MKGAGWGGHGHVARGGLVGAGERAGGRCLEQKMEDRKDKIFPGKDCVFDFDFYTLFLVLFGSM